jgi:hypothetical protein
MPATILKIEIYDNPNIEKVYSKAAWASQMAQTALMEFGRGNGTVMWGEIVGQNNVSCGLWQWAPGADPA